MTTKQKKPQHGDLKVSWIPQVPMEPYEVKVANLIEARLVLDTLALYDLFQLEHNIKPDYCNAGGLLVFDATDDHDGPDGSWCDWHDDAGNDIDRFTLIQFRKLAKEDRPKWELADAMPTKKART